MILNSLFIQDLRNHTTTSLMFGDGVHIIEGLNGAGKTTVLEAIAMASFTKTFLPTSDSGMIRKGADSYTIHAKATTALESPYTIGIQYVLGGRKVINSTVGDNVNPKDVIGQMPMVILSPDFKTITFGAPQDRRSFIDRILCQSSRQYLELLTNYKRILKQRNTLLSAKNGYLDKGVLEMWTAQLVEHTAKIMARRCVFLREFFPYMVEAYSEISLSSEQIELAYRPDSLDENDVLFIDGFKKETDIVQQLQDIFSRVATASFQEEVKRGTSVFGAHKDDIDISINGGLAKETASQGQHKSLLIALKSAEFRYLEHTGFETPILLLDDVFGELDKQRLEHVFATIIARSKQTFITTTESERFVDVLSDAKNLRKYRAESGSVSQIA